jgi:hypothetical protein
MTATWHYFDSQQSGELIGYSNLRPGLKENITNMAIHFTLLMFSSRLEVSNATPGGQLIKTVQSLTYSSSNDLMEQQRSDSLQDCEIRENTDF